VPDTPRGARRRRSYGAGVALAAGVLVASRWGWTTSRIHRTYDDGAYLASVDALAAGGRPFDDVFSSQGPLYLPLLRLADLAGAGAPWAPRLAVLAAGVALVVLVAAIARRATVAGAGAGGGAAARAGAVAALLVATSGALFQSTSGLESDGVAAAFGAASVLAAASNRRARGAAVLTGVLGGAALAVKSLLVVPALLAAWVLLLRRHGPRPVAAATALAAAVVLAASLPWGVGSVWDQYAVLHLRASGAFDPAEHLSKVLERSWDNDRLLVLGLGLAVVVAACSAGLARRSRRLGQLGRLGQPRRPHQPDGGAPSAQAARALEQSVWLWCAAAVAVLATSSPLQVHHTTALAVPLAAAVAVAVARHPLAVAALAGAAVLSLPAQADRVGWRWSAPEVPAPEAAVVAALREIEPHDAAVVVDDPGLAWMAERAVPGGVVDPSFVVIAAGFLSAGDIRSAAAEPGVCAVLLWSDRFASIPGLATSLDGFAGYALAESDGRRRLFVRDGCRLPVEAGIGAVGG